MCTSTSRKLYVNLPIAATWMKNLVKFYYHDVLSESVLRLLAFKKRAENIEETENS